MKIVKLLSLASVIAIMSACATEEAPTDGKALYSYKGCNNCHGDNAQGITGDGPAINDGSYGVSSIEWAINNVDDMSPYKGDLTSEQINAIAEYLTSL